MLGNWEQEPDVSNLIHTYLVDWFFQLSIDAAHVRQLPNISELLTLLEQLGLGFGFIPAATNGYTFASVELPLSKIIHLQAGLDRLRAYLTSQPVQVINLDLYIPYQSDRSYAQFNLLVSYP